MNENQTATGERFTLTDLQVFVFVCVECVSSCV